MRFSRTRTKTGTAIYAAPREPKPEPKTHSYHKGTADPWFVAERITVRRPDAAGLINNIAMNVFRRQEHFYRCCSRGPLSPSFIIEDEDKMREGGFD